MHLHPLIRACCRPHHPTACSLFCGIPFTSFCRFGIPWEKIAPCQSFNWFLNQSLDVRKLTTRFSRQRTWCLSLAQLSIGETTLGKVKLILILGPRETKIIVPCSSLLIIMLRDLPSFKNLFWTVISSRCCSDRDQSQDLNLSESAEEHRALQIILMCLHPQIIHKRAEVPKGYLNTWYFGMFNN